MVRHWATLPMAWEDIRDRVEREFTTIRKDDSGRAVKTALPAWSCQALSSQEKIRPPAWPVAKSSWPIAAG